MIQLVRLWPSTIDRERLGRMCISENYLEAIDPNLAGQLIAPAEEATDKEIKETSADLAKIFSGQVVNAPQGANSQLRLQFMQTYLQGTEEIPATDIQQRMQEDENFAKRLQTYAGQLEQQQAQQRTL